MRFWTIFVPFCVLLAAVSPASANDGSAITPTESTLWWHSDGDTAWINTLGEDPAHTTDTDGYNALIYVTGLGSATFEMPMAPAFTTAAPLDPDGEVVFYAYPGGSAADIGVIDSVDFLLTAGGETVSEAAAVGPFILQGAPTEITAAGAVAMAEIPDGAEVLWTITFYGASGQLVLVGAEGSWTRIELPVLGADDGDGGTGGDENETSEGDAPEFFFEDVSGDTFSRSLTFDGGGTVHIFNWTMPDMQEAHVRFDVTAESGLAYFGVGDPDADKALAEWGTEESGVFEETVPVSFDGDVLEVGAAGDGFTGTIDIFVEPVPMEEEAPVEDAGPAPEEDQNETLPVQAADSDAEDGNDASGPVLPVLLLSLLSFALMRRRR